MKFYMEQINILQILILYVYLFIKIIFQSMKLKKKNFKF